MFSWAHVEQYDINIMIINNNNDDNTIGTLTAATRHPQLKLKFSITLPSKQINGSKRKEIAWWCRGLFQTSTVGYYRNLVARFPKELMNLHLGLFSMWAHNSADLRAVTVKITEKYKFRLVNYSF